MTTKGIASNTNRVEGPARPRLLALNVRRPNRGRFGGQIGVSGETADSAASRRGSTDRICGQARPNLGLPGSWPGQHKLSTAFGYDVDPVNTNQLIGTLRTCCGAPA
jgi:hypothetical protein